MAFTGFSARDIIVSDNNLLCDDNPSVLQCPRSMEAVGWVVLLLVLIFLWKLVDNRRKKTSSSTTAKSNSNSKEDHHPQLPLPYPQPPSDTYEDIVSTKELGPDSSTSTLVDPYLITNGFNNSLISQDDSFKRTAIPEPVLKWRESVVKNHSALDLPEPMVSKLDPTGGTTTTTGIRLHDDDDDDDKKLISSNFSNLLRPASPPPAYVRRGSPHS